MKGTVLGAANQDKNPSSHGFNVLVKWIKYTGTLHQIVKNVMLWREIKQAQSLGWWLIRQEGRRLYERKKQEKIQLGRCRKCVCGWMGGNQAVIGRQL